MSAKAPVSYLTQLSFQPRRKGNYLKGELLTAPSVAQQRDDIQGFWQSSNPAINRSISKKFPSDFICMLLSTSGQHPIYGRDIVWALGLLCFSFFHSWREDNSAARYLVFVSLRYVLPRTSSFSHGCSFPFSIHEAFLIASK